MTAQMIEPGAVLSPLDPAILGRQLHAGPLMLPSVNYRRLTQPQRRATMSRLREAMTVVATRLAPQPTLRRWRLVERAASRPPLGGIDDFVKEPLVRTLTHQCGEDRPHSYEAQYKS